MCGGFKLQTLGGGEEEKSLVVHPLFEPEMKGPRNPEARDRGNHDTGSLTYRCFLPDLTGFVSACYVRSIPPPAAAGDKSPQGLLKDVQPRMSGFRVTGHR